MFQFDARLSETHTLRVYKEQREMRCHCVVVITRVLRLGRGEVSSRAYPGGTTVPTDLRKDPRNPGAVCSQFRGGSRLITRQPLAIVILEGDLHDTSSAIGATEGMRALQEQMVQALLPSV